MITPRCHSLKTVLGVICCAGLSAGIATSVGATTERTIEIGTLECEVLPETRRNYIFRSTAEVSCLFKSTTGAADYYEGETGIRLGVDLSIKEKDKLRFVVVSSHEVNEVPPSFSLKGKYFGPSTAASLTYGVGVSALIGGSKGEISLQPIGIETTRGLGISAGLGYLYLEPGRK